MAASKQDITQWFDRGVSLGATHMIVVCDTFDYEDCPIFVQKGEDAKERSDEESKKPMQRVMEVYKLDPAMREQQLNEHRAFHYD